MRRAASARHRTRRRPRADHVGRPAAASPVPVLARATTAACATARMPQQRRLDLAQLDAEAADLHLLVGAAQVLELAVAHASAPGRRCGTSGCPARPNGSATNRSAVSPAGPGSRAPARARDVQLARHPGRHRLQPAVEHVDPQVGRPRPIEAAGARRHDRLGSSASR